jgi:hypothetical protein
MQAKQHWYFLFLIGAGLLAILTIAIDVVLFGPQGALHLEGRGVETATFVVLAYGFIGFLVLAPQRAFGASWHVPVVLFLLAARELDLDKRFLADGVFRAKLYSSDHPLSHKLVGGAVLVVTIWALWRLIRRSGPGWARALSGRESWALLTGAALCIVVVAKSLDGAGRKLKEMFDIEISSALGFRLWVAEEMLELLFALLVVAALALWARRVGV